MRIVTVSFKSLLLVKHLRQCVGNREEDADGWLVQTKSRHNESAALLEAVTRTITISSCNNKDAIQVAVVAFILWVYKVVPSHNVWAADHCVTWGGYWNHNNQLMSTKMWYKWQWLYLFYGFTELYLTTMSELLTIVSLESVVRTITIN